MVQHKPEMSVPSAGEATGSSRNLQSAANFPPQAVPVRTNRVTGGTGRKIPGPPLAVPCTD